MRWRRPLPAGIWAGRQGIKKPLPLLVEANQLMAQNNFPAAAILFEKIAITAEGRNGPRAPIFFLQAGKARIFCAEVTTGMDHIRHGMTLLHNQKRFEEFNAAGSRVIRELEENSLIQEAAELKTWMSSMQKEGDNSRESKSSGSIQSSRGLLPTDCPSCGGRIHPNEVVWVDHITIECSYCGGLIRSDAS